MALSLVHHRDQDPNVPALNRKPQNEGISHVNKILFSSYRGEFISFSVLASEQFVGDSDFLKRGTLQYLFQYFVLNLRVWTFNHKTYSCHFMRLSKS